MNHGLADEVKTHFLKSERQNGRQEVRVLLPGKYDGKKKYKILYVLPVEAGFDQKYGYGLGVFQKMNAHNLYDLIIVQMGFEKVPWFGDHAANPSIRQASYLKEDVVPFIETNYSALARLSLLAAKESEKPFKIAKLVVRSSLHRLFAFPCWT